MSTPVSHVRQTYQPPPPPLRAKKIVYPDSDGEPMAENTIQYRLLVTIKEGLEGLFRERPDVFVAGDLFWYPVEGRRDIRYAPDVLVVFGRPKGDRGSYQQWLEGGIAPQVVFEIWSPGNKAWEKRKKFRFYEDYGVEEYYTYDPDRGLLKGWLREAGWLTPIVEMAGWISPRLGVRFEIEDDDLALYRRDGTRFETPLELLERAEAEARRAKAETKRADAAAKRADAAAKRADAAAKRAVAVAKRADAERAAKEAAWAKLRALGIDPETL
jgi:Uma2 family endonuclease